MPNPRGGLPAKARWADEVLKRRAKVGLQALLADCRSQDPPLSWDSIAREIEFLTQREVSVSGTSVAYWARKLGIVSGEAA